MDGPTTILLVLAPFPIVLLGLGLVVAPARVTSALNEWYVLPPAVRAEQRIRLTLVRAIGAGLVVMAVGLELRAISLLLALSS